MQMARHFSKTDDKLGLDEHKIGNEGERDEGKECVFTSCSNRRSFLNPRPARWTCVGRRAPCNTGSRVVAGKSLPFDRGIKIEEITGHGELPGETSRSDVSAGLGAGEAICGNNTRNLEEPGQRVAINGGNVP